jgi:RecA-family ATPase
VTDLNDILQQQNGHAVRSVLDSARPYRNGQATLQDRMHEIETEIALELICAAGLLSKAAREREWLAADKIPKNEVTLLSGDGGLGKSTLGLQLTAAGALNTRWLGCELPAAPFRSLVLSSEDDEDEMRWRLGCIVAQDCPYSREDALRAMEAVFLIDATRETDPLLATYDPKKGVQTTPLYHAIKRVIREKQIDLFVIDSAADVFSEEKERHAVRSFIRLLRSLGCTVLLLAHPSVDGMRSGRGYSGSTHWNNSVRSRLYLTKATADDDSEPDPDLRVLELAKANRGQAGRKITLRWQDGLFVPEDGATDNLNAMAREIRADEIFVEIASKLIDQGQTLSPNKNQTYAPRVVRQHPDADGFGKREMERAFARLMDAGRLKTIEEGPPSRRYKRIIVAEDQA